MRSFTVQKRISRTAVYLVTVCLAVTFLLPFVWMLRSSLMGIGQIFIVPPEWIPDPWMWQNYRQAMTLVPFLVYYRNTLVTVAMGVGGTVITASLVAYGYSRIWWRFRDLFFGLSLSSLMLPSAVTLIPVFLGYQRLGLYDTLWPLFLPAWFGGGAFNIFLLRQFFMGIPKELDEAAFMDGAGHLTVFWSVILPLSKSALIVVGLFAFLNYWNDFFTPMIYLESSVKYTVAVGLRQFLGQYVAQWPLLMAASTLATLPAVLIFFIGQNYFVQGIVMSGLKG